MNSAAVKFVRAARPWPNSEAPAQIRAGARGGLTIVELLVVMGIIAAVIAIAMPVVSSMEKSYDDSGAKSMIESALATARTLAMTHQQYVGLRFQKAWKTGDDPLEANQYMIFIIYDKDMGSADDTFRAVKGYKPIKLPENIGVMEDIDSTGIYLLTADEHIINATTLTILFSPAGKLAIHKVRARNRDGVPTAATSKDSIFNVKENVNLDKAMFIQDDNSFDGLKIEMSRNKLKIYDRKYFKEIESGQRHDYIDDEIKTMYINAYTGAMIE